MSIEEDKQLLLYYAAVAVLRSVNIAEVQKTIKRLMNAGIYHDAFIDVEYTKSDTTHDFIPALANALSSLGMSPALTKEEATRVIIKKHLSDIAKRKTAPFEGLEYLVSAENLDFGPVKKYVGDYYHIEYFIGSYWEYDDLIGRGERLSPEELKEEEKRIAMMAIEWLKNNESN